MRQSLTLIGTALTLAMTANVALAESSKSLVAQSSSSSPISSTEIKLSPEGFKILCMRFPLNSRCEGGQAATPNTSGNTTVEILPAETTSTPETTTLPASNIPESTTTAPESISPQQLPNSGLPTIPSTGN